ncbi:hypothetical protein OL548_05405 [Lysinibacillus sp. MHQ-1]|nr:hypothetical protein OL548_05405 [Lysinibacillus sp. MHQ-1]
MVFLSGMMNPVLEKICSTIGGATRSTNGRDGSKRIKVSFIKGGEPIIAEGAMVGFF